MTDDSIIDPQADIAANNHSDTRQDRQIIVPSDAMPPVIHVLPQEHRPFFPGQVIPLVMHADTWLPTLKSIRESKQDIVGLLTLRDKFVDPFRADQVYPMGTLCRIHRVHRQDQTLQVMLEGLQRFRITRWIRTSQPLIVSAQYFADDGDKDATVKAYAVAVINTIKELIPLNPLYGEELKAFLTRSNPNEPSVLADFAASLTTASKEELQRVLETLPLLPRLEMVLELLNNEVQIARAQMEIRSHVDEEIQKRQREAVLRQQLKFIQQELGLTKDDKTAELETFRARLDGKQVPEATRKRIDEELHKLSLLELGSPEYGVTRNYLDWLTAMPWGVHSKDVDDLKRATRALNRSHQGLDDAKERIVEHLAVGIMKGDVSGSILLLVGPPGVGKTSLGRSIATAIGRKFYRFSVGGMRDEAEIKGHRRTYIGALPGKLVQALKDCGTANPVIVLDEIDKMGSSFQGDPGSALLEVLDPEQNSEFRDHYLDTTMDLSKAFFICTANQLDTIPPALLDRMEVVHLSGYLAEEKLSIARKHLLPRLLKRAGLTRSQLTVSAAALRQIIEGYAREAGVRRLEKSLGAVVRKAVVQLLNGREPPVRVDAGDLESFLGKPPFQVERKQHGVGVVTGLAWTPLGGATLPVEASYVHAERGGFKMTGQLGNVMKESAEIAYSVLTASGQRYGVPAGFFANAFVHLHVPAGATPKDGPSAGITMATALLSLARGTPSKSNVAMTGELTLTGQVYPVGGIREKLLAAKRQNIREVILPEANRADYESAPIAVVKGIRAHFADHFDDVVRLVFPQQRPKAAQPRTRKRKVRKPTGKR